MVYHINFTSDIRNWSTLLNLCNEKSKCGIPKWLVLMSLACSMMAMIGVLSLFTPFTLVFVNVVSGMNYWDSWYFVFEERKTSVYLQNAIGSISETTSKLRFITWIF